MGQRSPRPTAVTPNSLEVSVFPTPLGYWAILGSGKLVFGLTLGQASAQAAQQAFFSPFDGIPIDSKTSDWNPDLRRRLERYAAGERVTFQDIQLRLPTLTVFQQKIIDLTRKLKHGETITYGDLATRANHPRAARAVGTVMATNRFPVIIPCHRVVGSGNLGGYSAPQGLTLKSRLLELEGG